MAIDAATASRYGYVVGDRMVVAGNGATSVYRIVGILHFAGSGSLSGAGVAVMTLSEAQRVAAEAGRFNEINVSAQSGVTPNQLARRIEAVLAADVSVLTGTQQAAQQTSNFEANLGFLQTFLLVFAYVALFVGAFIIFNTFSITVAQRTREFGLLRALGATRHQIMNSVMAESVVLGLAGSAVGLGLGLVAAPGLDQLLKAFGVDLPDTGIVVAARTVVVSMVVGTTVSVLASLAPTLRSTRVPPIAALQEGVNTEPGRFSRLALPLTIVVLAIGAFFVVEGLTGHGGTLALGVGALAVFVGIAALSPRFVPQLAGAIGLLVAWRGITGQLAVSEFQTPTGPHRGDCCSPHGGLGVGQLRLDRGGRNEGFYRPRRRRVVRGQSHHRALTSHVQPMPPVVSLPIVGRSARGTRGQPGGILGCGDQGDLGQCDRHRHRSRLLRPALPGALAARIGSSDDLTRSNRCDPHECLRKSAPLRSRRENRRSHSKRSKVVASSYEVSPPTIPASSARSP